MKDQRRSRDTARLSLTSALDRDGWLTPPPGRFTPGLNRYPLYRRVGGLQGYSARVWKIWSRPVFDSWTCLPAASHYTDLAILVHVVTNTLFFMSPHIQNGKL